MTSHSSWKRGVYEGLVGVVKKTIKHWEGKSSTLMEGTMQGNKEDIRYSNGKVGVKEPGRGSDKTTTIAAFIVLLGLSLLPIAGGQSTCDDLGVVDRIPQPHGCPQVEGIVKRVQVTAATREYQRAKAILCTGTVHRV
uniref:Polyprotein n=1 Tax=Ascaris lumbricoides TaxID=6252 RepID=A0A0M3IMV2_ASCLU